MKFKNSLLVMAVIPLTMTVPYSNINTNQLVICDNNLKTKSNDVVPENQLIASKPTDFETIAIDEGDQPIIPNTNQLQEKQLQYILGKYPSSSIEKVENTIPFNELSRIGVKYFNKTTDIGRMVSELNGFQNEINSSGFMEFNNEILIPLNKLVDKNRLDILYRDGTTFKLNIVNRFKNGANNSKYDLFNENYSFVVLPEDLQSNDYIEKAISDLNFSFKANANLDADVNFKPMKIRFSVNKEFLKINLLDSKLNLIRNTYFDLISNSGISLKKLFPIRSEFSLMINSITYNLVKNYSSKVDDIGSPKYVGDVDSGKVYINKPIPVAINSPFMISFKPMIGKGSSFDSLLFVDSGNGSFQQVGIDPKTGLQVFDFFKTYNEIIKSNKLTGINKIRIQIRKSDKDGNFKELNYYRIFEMSINSAQMYFDLYGYDNKKYSDILKLYTSKTVEELNKNSSTYKSDKKQTPNKYYREFLDTQTGMYKPKIAWVKYRNKNGFLLDPYDENNKKMNEETDQSKYDVGFIAELNAPALYSSDLKTSDQIGAVNQIIDVHYTNTIFNVNTEYSVNPDFKYPDGKKPSIKLFKQKVSSIPFEDNNEYKEKIFDLVYELLSDEDKKTFDVIDPINTTDKFRVSKIEYNYLSNSINVSWEFPNYYLSGKVSDSPKQGNFTLNGFDSTSKFYINNKYNNKTLYSSSSDKSLISNAYYSLIDFSKENSGISVNEYINNQVINNTPIGSPDESKNIYRYDVSIKKPNFDNCGSESINNLDKIEDQVVYQFLKIDNTENQKLWQEFVNPNNKNTKTIFDWFNYKNSIKNSSEKINDEIFVDFWSTVHGFHLIEFLKQNGIVQEGGEVKFMQTVDLKSVLNYWKIYVNSATIQNINFPNKMLLSELELSKINTSFNNKNDVENYKNSLLILINSELVKQLNFHYIFKENEELKPEDLVYGIDYEIPNLDQIINILIENYNDKNAFKGFELRIKSIPGSSKIFGETKITIANYEGAKLLLDLGKIKSPTIVNFNSWNRGFNDVVFPSLGNDKNGKVKKIISDSIQTILDRNSKKSKKYKIKYNVDYTIKFKRLNPINLNVEYSTNINDAVMWLLDESIEKNNTIDAIVSPINNEEILPKATGQTMFRFNNSETNEVISNDPESSQILPEWIDDETTIINPDNNGNNQEQNVPNSGNLTSKYIKENLGWIVPTAIGVTLFIAFVIWAIRVRVRSTKMKI